MSRVTRHPEWIIHFIALTIVFTTPFLFKEPSDILSLGAYVRGCIIPLCSAAIFYLNYFRLVDRLLLTGHRLHFALSNLAAIIGALIIQAIILHYLTPQFLPETLSNSVIVPDYLFERQIFLVLSSLFAFLFAIILSTALRQYLHLLKVESDMNKAEFFPLKSQFGPHFLLNTLNNIYSLTTFDVPKAQQAIQNLARLLRYMLYESPSLAVPLKKVIFFIEQYIELMKLRLSDEVEVSLTTDIAAEEPREVVPFIFITIVENAFKHGIAPMAHSFIHINVSSTPQGDVILHVENTNHPAEKRADQAPGGLGLKLVQRRLDLCYPDSYTWTYGPSPDGTTYSSEIIIKNDQAPLLPPNPDNPITQ